MGIYATTGGSRLETFAFEQKQAALWNKIATREAIVAAAAQAAAHAALAASGRGLGGIIGEILGDIFFPAPAGPEKEGIGGVVLERGKQVRGNFPLVGEPGSILYRANNGKVTHYIVYAADGLPYLRVDLVGRAHGGIPTPHAEPWYRDVGPDGNVYARRGRVRPATWLELTE
jgi:hypothetical protein